jgi:hypothetical protein
MFPRVFGNIDLLLPISAEIKKCKKMAEETGRGGARRKDYALCGKNFRA